MCAQANGIEGWPPRLHYYCTSSIACLMYKVLENKRARQREDGEEGEEEGEGEKKKEKGEEGEGKRRYIL